MSQRLQKTFSWWSLMGVAFSLTNSWLGVASSLVVGLSSGGPLLILFGLIIGMFFSLMCGFALSEFSSILPNASGSCFWVLKLLSEPASKSHVEIQEIEVTGKDFDTENCLEEMNESLLEQYCDAKNLVLIEKWKKTLGLLTGLINYAGAVFTSSSICASLALSILGVYSLMHPSYEMHHWHVFLTYELLNITIALVSSWAKWQPKISQFGLGISVFSYLMTFLICIVSRSFDHSIPWPTRHAIFREFKNTTGWHSSAMAFIVGLINPLWAFAGIDSATHMVDDVGYNASRRLVPRAIISTIVLGFLTSFTYAIAMFFCVTDSEEVIDSILPILQIYYQATGRKSLSAFMQCCCIITGLVCGFSSSTWQNRILWSVSRTYHDISYANNNQAKSSLLLRLGTISSNFGVPLYAHLLSHLFVAIIGCIFMGSSTAFNAIITACISLLLMSYAIPCFVLVFWVGKEKFFSRVQQEQQAIGIRVRKLRSGFLCLVPHILTILWAIFCLVMLSFPYTLPVTKQNMNYVSVVYGVMVVIVVILLMF